MKHLLANALITSQLHEAKVPPLPTGKLLDKLWDWMTGKLDASEDLFRRHQKRGLIPLDATFEEWKETVKEHGMGMQFPTQESPHWWDVNVHIMTTKVEQVGDMTLDLRAFHKRLIRGLDEFLARRGWFVKFADSPSSDHITTTISPNYGIPLKKSDWPPYFLHVTSKDRVDSIKKRGLIPSTAQRRVVKRRKAMAGYPPRVYLTGDDRSALGMSMAFKKQSGTEDTAVIVVDPRQFRPGTRVFFDPDAPLGAFWTYTHIPPEAIVDIAEIRPR